MQIVDMANYDINPTVYISTTTVSGAFTEHQLAQNMSKLQPAGQIRPAGSFILARRHLRKLKLPP